jgi:hypothetical protein
VADEQDIQVIVAEMIGGRILIFGLPGEDDPDEKIKGMFTPIDPQFLTRQDVFGCPFCQKALVPVQSPTCPACGGDFTSAEAQAALRNVQVQQVFGTRMWSQRHDLNHSVRVNANNITAWSITQDWSETRTAWFKEREDSEKREAEARAERSGILVASEAEAAAMARQKSETDAALKNLPGDDAGPFKVVK